MEENTHINYLFQKYLNNDYSEDDLTEILQYFQLSSHEDYLIQLIEKELDKPSTSELLEIQSIGDSIASSLFEKTRPKPVRQFRMWLPYAAAVALVLLGGIMYYLNTRQDDVNPTLLSNENIMPGVNRATIKLGSGQVLSLNDSEDGIINQGNAIVYNDGSTIQELQDNELITLTTPRAGQYSVVLSDGTRVWLNAMSEIIYPSQFDKNERNVWVKGEAYFEVAHDKYRPFYVHSEKQKISVLGTKFNVHAYENDNTHHTTLVEGSVEIYSNINKRSIVLKPDQQAVNNEKGGFAVNKVDASEFIAWKDGLIFLNGYELGEIFSQLERWYDVDFVNVPSSLQSERLYGVIRRDVPLKDVLETIKDNFSSVQFEINGRRVLMSIK